MKIVSNIIETHIFRKKNSEIEFLLLKRAETERFAGIWQMVTGFIEDGEVACHAALRELKEETGLTPYRFWVVPKVNHFYSQQKNEMNMVPIFAAQIKDNYNVELSDEHSEFIWLNIDETKKRLAWPGQREAVDIITEYFTNKKSSFYFNEIDL